MFSTDEDERVVSVERIPEVALASDLGGEAAGGAEDEPGGLEGSA